MQNFFSIQICNELLEIEFFSIDEYRILSQFSDESLVKKVRLNSPCKCTFLSTEKFSMYLDAYQWLK